MDSSPIALSWRSLTSAEALRIHEELKSTPHILGYTVRELERFPRVLVARAEGCDPDAPGGLAGICINKDLLFGWTDMAVLYVLPVFRGRKLGSSLFHEALADALGRGRSVYVLSRSPEAIHLMEGAGLTMTRSVWKAPLAVHLHMNVHMSSAYRMREAGRKARLRKDDGNSFVAGVRRPG